MLDYLYRDWHHIGKPKYYEKRLFQYMEIREDTELNPKFVINLGTKERPRTDAISAIVDLLECRYQLSETVLFHRTKCSATAMLERALQEIDERAKAIKEEDGWRDTLESELLDRGDSGVIDYLISEAKRLRAPIAVELLQNLMTRNLYRQAYTFFFGQKAIVGQDLQKLYSGGGIASQKRLALVRKLETDFYLPPGSVAVYCPSKDMNRKLASVNLYVGGRVASFTRWAASDSSLGSDHLNAQTKRFERLWRIHISVARPVWKQFSDDEKQLFKDVIKYLALGVENEDHEETYMTAAKRLAEKAITINAKRFEGFSVIENQELLAANDRSGTVEGTYPTGAPTIQSFLLTTENG